MGKTESRSFDPQHPVTDADVRLYVLLPVFLALQLLRKVTTNTRREAIPFSQLLSHIRCMI
jgi:hypothetical protein